MATRRRVASGCRPGQRQRTAFEGTRVADLSGADGGVLHRRHPRLVHRQQRHPARSTRIMFPPSPFPLMSPFRVRGRSARQLAGNPPSHPARPQHIAGQPGNDRDDAQAQKRRQIAQAQRPAISTDALSCRSCEDSPARHTGWSHYWQPGGPMTVAKLGSNGPMNVASDNALPRMRNHLQCHKSRSRRWRQHRQG